MSVDAASFQGFWTVTGVAESASLAGRICKANLQVAREFFGLRFSGAAPLHLHHPHHTG